MKTTINLKTSNHLKLIRMNHDVILHELLRYITLKNERNVHT